MTEEKKEDLKQDPKEAVKEEKIQVKADAPAPEAAIPVVHAPEAPQSPAPAADAAVQVFRYGENSEGGAERFLQIALRTKVDGLIMFCQADTDIQGLRLQAARSNVIFVPVGTDPPKRENRGFIGSGSSLQGLRGGNLIGAALGKQARVGLILPDAIEGDPREVALYRGLVVALGNWPGARVAMAVQARHGILSGEEATALLVRSGEAINAIFCSSAQDTEGAAQVLVDMNLVGRIMVIGADETAEIRRFIDKGIISASIVRDSHRIGQEAVRAFVGLKSGGKPQDAVEAGFVVRTAKGIER